jgi:hypothetical protein
MVARKGAAMAKALAGDLRLLDQGPVNLRHRPAQLRSGTVQLAADDPDRDGGGEADDPNTDPED